jgi:hypothetical protein
MPQISVWNPTRGFLKQVAAKMSDIVGRPVKQNEVVHDALIEYARSKAGMDQATIDTILAQSAKDE